MTYNQELVHYGVKGMRWGRRKASSASNDGKNLRTRIKERDAMIRDARTRRSQAEAELTIASQKWNNAKSAGASEKKVKALQAVEKKKAQNYIDVQKKYGATAKKNTASEYAVKAVGAALVLKSVRTAAGTHYMKKRLR